LNWFHTTTQPYVIEREVLFRVGSRYDQSVSDEIERNLRLLLLFSVVVALPLEGSQPGSVRYLVVTKDLWSLRLGWNGRINKGVIDYLSLQPTERNLFGHGRQLFGTLVFGRRSYTVGAGFLEPRLAGSRTRILFSANAIVNCEKGEIEGSSGSFQYSKPLYSTTTKWSYSTSLSWTNTETPLSLVGDLTGSICSAKSAEEVVVALPNGKAVYWPNQYKYDAQSFTQTFTRSYGIRYKTNLGFGIEASRYAYAGADLSNVRAAPSEIPGDLTEAERVYAISRYNARIPLSDTRISPFFDLTAYTTKFHRDINSETLGLQEDYDFRLGHIANVRIYPALEALGSTRDMLGVDSSVSYAWEVDTGYLKASIGHSVELSRPQTTDAALTMALRFTSPRLALGRFVFDTRLTDHYRNYRNTNLGLGGTGRLRGYQTTATLGSHQFVSNVEFRSRPIEIFSAQLAAVVFHDMGDTFDRFADAHILHGVGGGIRFLAPQLDRDVFRVDVGVPVPLDQTGGEVSVIATFGQAFNLP
jgi:outer membrane protein assembly factor BamA